MRASTVFGWAIVTGAMLAPTTALAQAIDTPTTPPPMPSQTAGETARAQPVPIQEIDPKGDAPIVPDSEFEDALPPITDDIEAPLEPMPAEGPLLPVSPLAQGAEEEQQQPAAQADAELQQPLPPIATFDSVPLQAAADEQNAGKTPQIRYDVTVNGLNAIGLDDQFRDLSALEEGGGKADNATMIYARAKQDEDLAVRLMRSIGYYDATALSTIEQEPSQPGRVRVIVSATPGQLYRLGAIAIAAPPTVPPDLIR